MKRLLNTLYVTNPDARLHKKDDAIEVVLEDGAMSVPFHLLEGIVLFGHASCSMVLLGECAKRGISVVILDEQGRFCARVDGPISGNVLLRRAQYRKSDSESVALSVAQRFVAGKIHNSRIVLQRAVHDYGDEDGALLCVIESLREGGNKAFSAASLNQLRGVEGEAAQNYFATFSKLIRNTDPAFSFSSRTRRPPTDPINALLSFFYSILSREVASSCEAVGLDPQIGFLHADRPGRASLALDLVEELRAPYVDRFVLSLVNRKQISSADFVASETGAMNLSDAAKKTVLRCWQEKKQEMIMHPFLKERIPLGLIPFVQAQLFARFLREDLNDYPAFLWR